LKCIFFFFYLIFFLPPSSSGLVSSPQKNKIKRERKRAAYIQLKRANLAWVDGERSLKCNRGLGEKRQLAL
jgi:hypothetical protein